MSPVVVRAVRVAFALGIATSLVAGLAGGLLRAGAVPAADWVARAGLAHAQLMLCGFIGTVIALERAIALRRAAGYAVPALAAAGGVLALGGAAGPAGWTNLAAALGLVAVNLALRARQPAPHATLLVVGAAAWGLGALRQLSGAPPDAIAAAWFAFVVLTVAAERLEMTRLMRRRPGAGPALAATVALLVAGVAAAGVAPRAGGVAFGLALAALAAWLLAFDVARRTVAVPGLPRYMAVCLLGGYAWLAIAGLAWATHASVGTGRDLALHALGLGFVLSMMFGHAPVILPALVRIKLLHGWPFYLPLALLHGSLALRFAAGGPDASGYGPAALGNLAAIVAFALTAAVAALGWRLRHARGAGAPDRAAGSA
jgi:hypothetical protein